MPARSDTISQPSTSDLRADEAIAEARFIGTHLTRGSALRSTARPDRPGPHRVAFEPAGNHLPSDRTVRSGRLLRTTTMDRPGHNIKSSTQVRHTSRNAAPNRRMSAPSHDPGQPGPARMTPDAPGPRITRQRSTEQRQMSIRRTALNHVSAAQSRSTKRARRDPNPQPSDP